MTKLVAKRDNAISNIIQFSKELKKNKTLQERLPYAKSWFAYRDESGDWHFGPSKFVGYNDMNAKKYLAEGTAGKDGRKTEVRLKQWFTELPNEMEKYDDLLDWLIEMFDDYDKVPNAGMRINVLHEDHEVFTELEYGSLEDNVVDLMIVVGKMLSSGEKSRLILGLK